jgi:hypothetical protein
LSVGISGRIRGKFVLGGSCRVVMPSPSERKRKVQSACPRGSLDRTYQTARGPRVLGRPRAATRSPRPHARDPRRHGRETPPRRSASSGRDCRTSRSGTTAARPHGSEPNGI